MERSHSCTSPWGCPRISTQRRYLRQFYEKPPATVRSRAWVHSGTYLVALPMLPMTCHYRLASWENLDANCFLVDGVFALPLLVQIHLFTTFPLSLGGCSEQKPVGLPAVDGQAGDNRIGK